MVKISEIVNQNPWWKEGKEFVRFEKKFKAAPIFFARKDIHFQKGNIYILRGPRQIGKTTYIKNSIKKLLEKNIPARSILYLSADFFISRRELRNAIEYFVDSSRDLPEIYIFLDEITSLDDWNLELKFIADQGIAQKATVLATGSSAVKLKEKGELLPGRGLEGNEYLLKPLAFREFARQSSGFLSQHLPPDAFQSGLINLGLILEESFPSFSGNPEETRPALEKLLPFKKELAFLFQLYVATGGFPGVINHYFQNRFIAKTGKINPEIAEIFVRDVLGDLARLQKQETVARQILKALLDRYGSRYSFSSLSREIEKPHLTTITYLDHLEDSFISFVLYAYDFNKNSIKAKGDKKVYFFDPFILHSIKSFLSGKEIWEVIGQTLESEELLGRIIEGIVVSHLLLSREIPWQRTGSTFLWSYYDKSGKEIDAVFNAGDEYFGIEIKYRSQAGEGKRKSIPAIKKYFLLSKEEFGKKGETTVVPVEIFLALLFPSERNL